MTTTDPATVGLGDDPVPEPGAVTELQVWTAPDPRQLPVAGDPGRLLESDAIRPGGSTE